MRAFFCTVFSAPFRESRTRHLRPRRVGAGGVARVFRGASTGGDGGNGAALRRDGRGAGSMLACCLIHPKAGGRRGHARRCPRRCARRLPRRCPPPRRTRCSRQVQALLPSSHAFPADGLLCSVVDSVAVARLPCPHHLHARLSRRLKRRRWCCHARSTALRRVSQGASRHPCCPPSTWAITTFKARHLIPAASSPTFKCLARLQCLVSFPPSLSPHPSLLSRAALLIHSLIHLPLSPAHATALQEPASNVYMCSQKSRKGFSGVFLQRLTASGICSSAQRQAGLDTKPLLLDVALGFVR